MSFWMSSVFIKNNSRKANKVAQLETQGLKVVVSIPIFYRIANNSFPGRKIHNFVTHISLL